MNMKTKRLYTLLLFVVGMVFIILSVFFKAYSSQLIGIGGGLLGVAIGRAISLYRYRKDPEYAKEAEIALHDERNLFLQDHALAIAGKMLMLIIGIVTLIATFVNRTLMMAGAMAICLYLVLYLITYFILSKKY